jgi:hypothetical protein
MDTEGKVKGLAARSLWSECGPWTSVVPATFGQWHSHHQPLTLTSLAAGLLPLT